MGEAPATIRLPANASSPRRARLFVDEVLHRWRRDAAIERAALIVSELVTNAVRHAHTEVTVRLEARLSSIYLEVADRHEARPQPTVGGDPSAGGRGLAIVDALASSWGIEPRTPGKAVWVEIAD